MPVNIHNIIKDMPITLPDSLPEGMQNIVNMARNTVQQGIKKPERLTPFRQQANDSRKLLAQCIL